MISLVVLGLFSSVQALDNGLALTPPMGWLTWERFRCITDCNKYPNECISENLVKRTADLLVSEGYLEAGYEYLGIDDCWLEKERGPDGRMVPDRRRFPNGMKYVADYIHKKGLKFGLYQDYGNKTCAGYPGVLGNEKVDINSLVEWEVDYLKLDGCYIDPKDMDEGYPAFGKMLNETGRPIVYSCSWPAYQEPINIHADYTSIAKHCNLWRNWDDIEDSWSSVTKIMDWFGDNQDRFASHAGPGHWNDPDMINVASATMATGGLAAWLHSKLPRSIQYIGDWSSFRSLLLNIRLIIGNFGLSVDQSRVQMAVWAVMAAPLLISTDLSTIRPEFKEIILNKEIIAVNQDKLGKQGTRVWKMAGSAARSRLEIWKRELYDGSYAIAFVSRRDDGTPYAANFSSCDMDVPQQAYTVKDLYDEEPVRTWEQGHFETRINPSGVKFYKFIPKKANDSQDNIGVENDMVVKIIVKNQVQ